MGLLAPRFTYYYCKSFSLTGMILSQFFFKPQLTAKPVKLNCFKVKKNQARSRSSLYNGQFDSPTAFKDLVKDEMTRLGLSLISLLLFLCSLHLSLHFLTVMSHSLNSASLVLLLVLVNSSMTS